MTAKPTQVIRIPSNSERAQATPPHMAYPQIPAPQHPLYQPPERFGGGPQYDDSLSAHPATQELAKFLMNGAGPHIAGGGMQDAMGHAIALQHQSDRSMGGDVSNPHGMTHAEYMAAPHSYPFSTAAGAAPQADQAVMMQQLMKMFGGQ